MRKKDLHPKFKVKISNQCEGDSLVDAVKDAIDLGYRMFDTSRFYCNEKELGKGIRAKIREGVVRREDIFVITKVSI